MNVTITADLPLSEDEERQLATIMGVEEGEIDEALSRVASAALEEYVRMFLGQKVFTRGQDMLEYRLFLLIKAFFEERIPPEQRICELFQMTTSQSRSLVRSVMSKYQYELSKASTQSLVDCLSKAVEAESGDYELTIDAYGVLDGLSRLLAEADRTLPPISKKRNTLGSYVIKPSAYRVLRRELGMEGEENE